jgi:Kelch motif
MRKASCVAAVAAVSSLLAPAAARAVVSGSFTPTGAMMVARTGAAAAPLGDGRVLVAGGQSLGYFQSAEIFNPTTNTFSLTGSMGTPRTYAAAAPLPDGRVLVAGGFNGSSNLASAEIFNPASNSFTPTSGPMSTPRYQASAAPLSDGRVLVVGGDGSTDYEIFNPATGTFSTPSGSAISGPLRAAAAAQILGGPVLLVGGTENGTTYLSSTLIFNGVTWGSGVSSMTTPRLAPGAASLPGGGALIVGGQSGPFNYLSSAEVYDPIASTFTTAGIGLLSTPRGSPAAAPLADGRVLVAGGFDGSSALSSAEIFAATNTFSFKVKGKSIVVSVRSSGKVAVVDAGAPLSAGAAARKRKLLLKPSSGSGDPPAIKLSLHLSKLAKSRLRQKGKLTVRARITFTPLGGLANTETAKLKIKSKRR